VALASHPGEQRTNAVAALVDGLNLVVVDTPLKYPPAPPGR
jgi:hypothetical protein